MSIKEAIILAGGKGTRLQSLLHDIPKCMAPVNGKPFISYIIDYLVQSNISKVIISVGYRKEYIISNLNDIYSGIEIIFSQEDVPLGTGGAIKAAMKYMETDLALVLNGDTFFRPDLHAMLNMHTSQNADLSIAAKKMPDVSRYGKIICNEKGKIISFAEKNISSEAGLINGGIYLIGNNLFDKFHAEVFSIENEFFKQKVSELHFQAFISEAEFLDIGIPEDYKKAASIIKFATK